MDDPMDFLALTELAAEDGDVVGRILRPKPGCTYRAYRRHPSAHAIVLRWDVAKHLSRCPVFERWLWSGRKVRQRVRKNGARCAWYTGYEPVSIVQVQDGPDA